MDNEEFWQENDEEKRGQVVVDLQQTVSDLQNIRDTISKKIERTLKNQIKRDELYKNDLVRKLAS